MMTAARDTFGDARDALLRELVALVPLKEWGQEDLATLELIAEDVVKLSQDVITAPDETTRARARRTIEMHGSHVGLLAYSRLNTTEKNAQEVLRRVIDRFARMLVGAVASAL